MKKETYRANRGFTILEPLLAGALLSLVTLSIVSGLLYAQRSIAANTEHTKALFLAEEGLEAAHSIRDGSFTSLSTGSWGLTHEGSWELTALPDVTDGLFTRTITITADGDTRNIESSVAWDGESGAHLTTLATRLTNWHQ